MDRIDLGNFGDGDFYHGLDHNLDYGINRQSVQQKTFSQISIEKIKAPPSIEETPPQQSDKLAEIKEKIKRNIKIQNQYSKKSNDTLYIVTTVFSPYGYDQRFGLAQDFIHRIEELEQQGQPLAIYVVEGIFEDQSYSLKMKESERHLKISLPKSSLFWSKESFLNFGVRHLPHDWKYMAWIDADIEFIDNDWATQAIRKFKRDRMDVLQLFSYAIFHNSALGPPYNLYTGIYKYEETKRSSLKHTGVGRHPGFAWAITREAYEKIGGLLDVCIVGGGDDVMANAFIGNSKCIQRISQHLPHFRKYLYTYFKRSQGLRCSYLDTIVRHHYHGKRKNRQYSQRQKIIRDLNYNPLVHLYRDPESGLVFPSDDFPTLISQQIDSFFKTRREKIAN